MFHASLPQAAQRQSWWLRPEFLFLFISLAANLALLAMITPFAGGNERMNFQRAVLLGRGHVAIAPAPMPGGIQAILDLTSRYLDNRPAPFTLTADQHAHLAAIPLAPERPSVIQPNAIAVLHPVAYLPQAPVIAGAMALGASPLMLLELGRIAGLLAGLGLTFRAIRLAPRNRHTLAALALLPQPLFSRSTLDADQLTNGIAFLFLAMLLREIAGQGLLARRRLWTLAACAFLFAQAKSAYLLVPLLAWFIPPERFESRGQRWRALALIVLPGFVGSLAWMLHLRGGYFAHTSYMTWSGLVVPDRQVAAVLGNPLGYAGVLARTLFATPLLPKSLLDFVGQFGPPVSLPFWLELPLLWLLAVVFLSERPMQGGPLDGAPLRIAAAVVAALATVLILTLLYVQWTRLGAPTIDGWHGRYLYPLAPLLVLLGRGRGLRLVRMPPSAWLLLFATVSVGSTLWVTTIIY